MFSRHSWRSTTREASFSVTQGKQYKSCQRIGQISHSSTETTQLCSCLDIKMATAPPVEKEPEGVAADASSVDLEKYDRRPLKLRGIKIFALAFSTLGIIYSDIGTSPLYVLNGIWSASGDAPSKEDVIGGVSAIVWSITIIPLIKYVSLDTCMYADADGEQVGFALEFGTGPGEGGPFALFMTLFPSREPRDDGRSLTTYPTNIFSLHGTGDRRDKLTRFKWPLFIWTIFGTSLTLADGVLT